MKHTTLFVFAVALFTLAACGPQGSSEPQVQSDSNSGGDEGLTGARGVFDDAVNDNVDATTGDNTDMKYVDIDGRGTLTLRVRFHSTDVAGTVTLLNEFGDVLLERPYAAGTTDVAVDNFDVFPGRYYVRIYASSGKSDYTVGQEFARDPNYLSAADIEWRDQQLEIARGLVAEGRYDEATEVLMGIKAQYPENRSIDELVANEVVTVQIAVARRYVEQGDYDEARALLEGLKEDYPTYDEIETVINTELDAVTVAEEASRSRHHRRRTREREPEPEFNPPEETTTEPEAEPEPEETSIRASIVTVRDRGAGSGTTLILTGCGTSSGLSEGDRGRIAGTSHRATITRITGGNSCEAESSASAGEIRSASRVEF